jgi:hypothetical protein
LATSGIEDSATRLLGAFYDLSGGKLKEPVLLRSSGDREGAAGRAGMDPDSTEPDVAVRYLLNKGYLEAMGAPSNAPPDTSPAYAITAPGMDLIRRRRGLDPTPPEGSKMSDKTQRILVTVLAIGLSQVLARPLTGFIGEQIPERRGVRDDFAEALLKGSTRMAAFLIASVLVRKLASR